MDSTKDSYTSLEEPEQHQGPKKLDTGEEYQSVMETVLEELEKMHVEEKKKVAVEYSPKTVQPSSPPKTPEKKKTENVGTQINGIQERTPSVQDHPVISTTTRYNEQVWTMVF